jgi:two-component system NtrC family sensor kinase
MAELPAVWGRADQLIQVLLNLIMNAIDAMSGGGSLCLRTTVSSVQPASDHLPASEAYLVIEVADNGKGINPELQERIFDPFFTTRADGTGLGLAISRKIIAQHDGIIRVQSAPNNGSTFTILLPFRQEMANAKEMKEMEE